MNRKELRQRVLTGGVLIASIVVFLVAASLFCMGRLLLITFGLVVMVRCAYEAVPLRAAVPAEAARGDEGEGLPFLPFKANLTNCLMLLVFSIGPIFAYSSSVGVRQCATLALVGPQLISLFVVLISGLFLGVLFQLGESMRSGHTPTYILGQLGLFVSLYLLVSVGGSFLIGTVALPSGERWVSFLIALVAATDTAAYFFGSKFGTTKLAPLISPKKTVTGAIAGVVAGVVVGGFMLRWLIPEHFGLYGLLLAAFASVVSQFGDLLKSIVKREKRVKDCGRLLPGHGGALDRLDGLLASGSVLYLWLLVKYYGVL